MQRYEYRAVPAPKKGKKAKGVRGAEARFAHALTDCMNDMAAEGWEYLRTDTLPSEERTGLTGRTTVFQNMLVFRREVTGDAVVQPSSLGAQVEALTEESFPRLPSATEAQVVTESEDRPAFPDVSEPDATHARLIDRVESKVESSTAEDTPEEAPEAEEPAPETEDRAAAAGTASEDASDDEGLKEDDEDRDSRTTVA
jgi:hypothetical protein